MKKSTTMTAVVIANLLLVLGVVNGSILKKQAIVDSGRRVFLELAPVDPRSLMQGDYMILNFALNRDDKFKTAAASGPTRNTAILKVDGNGIARFSRILTKESEVPPSLADDEVLLEYRKWRRGLRFGIESFFFEEGSAEKYERAKYAEVCLSDSGAPVLVDLHRVAATSILGD